VTQQGCLCIWIVIGEIQKLRSLTSLLNNGHFLTVTNHSEQDTLYTQGEKMKTTQLEKSQIFALNFASMLALQAALKEVDLSSAEDRGTFEKVILEAIQAHPIPAEA
jgi:hypothetical protein